MNHYFGKAGFERNNYEKDYIQHLGFKRVTAHILHTNETTLWGPENRFLEFSG